MTAVLELQNISKKIKKRQIIDHVSLEVHEGEVFGLLGPNGAGKTTIIRMIVGLMKITSGDAAVCGKSVSKHFEQAVGNVGAIVENPEMYKFLSGYNNLLQYARMTKGVTKEKIDEVIRLVGLQDRIHDKVKTYSLGMRQRLGIAQSLLHDPKLLILDEPTNGLDPAGIREIRDYLRVLAREKRMAVVVSSHLLSEMELMCDRIAIIDKGRLIEVQDLKKFVNAGTETYYFEVDNATAASAAIAGRSTHGKPAVLRGNGLEAVLKKEEIPEVLHLLSEMGIKVYEAKRLAKTLEDRFLEITKDSERGNAV